MRTIELQQPKKIVLGQHCASKCLEDMLALGLKRIFLVTALPIIGLVEPLVQALREGGCFVTIYSDITTEPTVSDFYAALEAAKSVGSDAVIGLGGGSVIDIAKLVATLYSGRQRIRDVFGIGHIASRDLYMACLPTTAGTGSEVSPNAILLDENEQQKKGIVSPYLVPDVAYIDPILTLTLPPALTASTGMDALTHCVEAYVNRFAHPSVDLYALEGIRLIASNIVQAVKHGDDLSARTQMSMGSLYGGLCLAPVNTAAVHALAYPLGGEFHVAHGVSNAILLPHVWRFNLPSAPKRYAEVALALGVKPGNTDLETAQYGLDRLLELSVECGIPTGMSELGIPEEAIPRMAEGAMKVTRLLKNNVREFTISDVKDIYRAAF